MTVAGKRHKVPIHLETPDVLLFGLTTRQTLVLGLGIACVFGQRRFVPHDAGLDHGLGEVEARRRAGLAAEHAVQRWAGDAGAILERVAGLALLVEHALAASGVARLGEGLRR